MELEDTLGVGCICWVLSVHGLERIWFPFVFVRDSRSWTLYHILTPIEATTCNSIQHPTTRDLFNDQRPIYIVQAVSSVAKFVRVARRVDNTRCVHRPHDRGAAWEFPSV